MTTAELEASSFLYGSNSAFIEQLYQRYLASPNSVDASWQQFFATLGDDADSVLAEARGASWSPRSSLNIRPDQYLVDEGDGEHFLASVQRGPQAVGAVSAGQVRQATLDSLRALMLIRNYRVRGHLYAKLDPLGLQKQQSHAELDPRTFGFTEADMDRPMFINYVLGLETATLREILDILERTYCGPIGVEFMHIMGPGEKAWIQERIEGRRKEVSFTDFEKRQILRELVESEGFERFLNLKYTGTKRFGLDGAESLMPLMNSMLTRAAQLGVREISLGMPHRGRLNVLTNLMRKPFTAIFSEFQGNPANPQDVQGSGDVKYHLGTSADRDFGGHVVHLSLSANPSHLEAVDPVVLGKARAKQEQLGDRERQQVMAVLMHGDAAFAGQGLVGECFALSDLDGYTTGGTVHVIVNNQIGFTTNPNLSRSSPYSSDVGKMVQTPIFHVNGDDPEAVCHIAKIASEFRQQFGKDVVIDMFCYRRHGHNEGDEPAFTQPLMYKAIAQHQTTREIYAKKLVDEGVVTQDEADNVVSDFHARLEKDFEAASSFKPNKADWLEGRWQGLERARGDARRGETSVRLAELQKIGQKLTEQPVGFNLHRTIRRQLENKRKLIEQGEGIDWATAEALAFGSLLIEGFPVRLSGQDSGRGTFSQRHSHVIDQDTEAKYTPLNHLQEEQARYEVIDTMLSEEAVLGFEYGLAMADPKSLVMWEAQFGDFGNGAQIVIDQFIAAGEVKWLRANGLVLLLPHGYEGQGPEHSSARLERFLQLCANDNIQVCNITTPANYFHVLRRQMLRSFRKPLVIMTPKSLLRHPLAKSDAAEFMGDQHFMRIKSDMKDIADEKVKRLVLCSGKVAYDLMQRRDEAELEDVSIVRIEQLYPFPGEPLAVRLERMTNLEQIVWCQEEPKNNGAWFFVDRLIEEAAEAAGKTGMRPCYAGREVAASPATGYASRHQVQQEALVNIALGLNGSAPNVRSDCK